MQLSFDRIVLTESRWSNFDAILTEVLPVKGDNIRRVDNEGAAIGKSTVKPDADQSGRLNRAGAGIGAITGGPVGAGRRGRRGAAFGVGAVVIERGKHINLTRASNFVSGLRTRRRSDDNCTGTIALLTDFGNDDYFVGAMKGVILSINPQAAIVDITHNVRPQDIRSAAFTLSACRRDFPAGTIFVAVVDPGVGRNGGRSWRRPKVDFCRTGQWFIEFCVRRSPRKWR